MIGKGIPIGLLPLGTANNIITSLGVFGKPRISLKVENLSCKKPYDVGLVKKSMVKTFFLSP